LDLDRTTNTAPQPDIPAIVPAIVPMAPGNEEVFREYVRVLAEHERLSLLANLPGIVLIAITALFLPFGRFVVGAALLRLVAVSLTRWRGRALRRALADGEPLARPVNALGVAVGFSGFTWALVLWPIAIHGVAEPAAALLIVYVCMGVPLLAVLAASIPRLMWAFAGSFFLTMCLEIGLNPGGDGTLLMLGLAGLFVTVVSAGRAMQRQQSKASLATLEKIALARALAEANEELAEALAQAEFLSQRDPLTGLSNRRAFMESSTHAEPCARRRHLLAIDLDHFKQVNDTFGHAVGDRVLIGVGDVLRDSIRGIPPGEHCAVRLGGEEFVMVLDGFDARGAAGVAELVRLGIAGISAALARPGLAVSASIGLCEWPAGEELEPVLLRADRALYRAKAAGRDRVMHDAA
jgi:diguanylate cyclase (GGDEF)-like protein